jgi:hypothetical protein
MASCLNQTVLQAVENLFLIYTHEKPHRAFDIILLQREPNKIKRIVFQTVRPSSFCRFAEFDFSSEK